MYLFVYGTLKKGHRNHHFLADAELIGDAWAYGYDMYSVGAFPCIVPVELEEHRARPYPRNNARITGEVYKIPDYLWGGLDRLEGVPHMYRRAAIGSCTSFIPMPWPREIETYIWNQSIEGLPIIESGVWA